MGNLSNHQVYLAHQLELARIKKQFKDNKITLAQAQFLLDEYHEKHKDLLNHHFEVDSDFKVKNTDEEC